MNAYSVLTPMITAVLLASTGLVVVDEAIEHGYTIPEISERYWDYEMQFLDERDLDNYTGKWSGEGYPNARVVEHEDGPPSYCGNFTTTIFISENNIKGSTVGIWDHLPDQGVLKMQYDMEGRINDDGVVNGTYEFSVELNLLINEPATIIDLINDGWTLGDEGNMNFSGILNNKEGTVSGAEGTECIFYANLVKEELSSSDSILQSIPGVDPYVGLLTGEPFESESNPDEETTETAIQVGTIGSVAGARQISKLRSKSKPREDLVTEKIVKDTVEKHISFPDIISEEVKDEDYNLGDEDILDEIEKDVEPKEEPWFAKVGGWVLDKTEKIADWVSDKAPGIGSVGASGVKNAGKIAEKGAEIAEERAKSRIKDSQNLEDISTDQMEDNWGYWRKKGVLDSVVKLVKDNSPVSMGAAFGTLGGIVGGAAGLILSGGTPSPLVLGGISAGGMIGSAIGSTLNSIFS